MRITGKELNLAEETFRLQQLLDAKLLPCAEEIEEICSAAIKEESIETKLAGIKTQWSSAMFTFTDYKTRGQVALQVGYRASFTKQGVAFCAYN